MGSTTDKRRVITVIIAALALGFSSASMILSQPTLNSVTIFLLVVTITVLVTPKISRPYTVTFGLVLWSVGTGILVGLAIHAYFWAMVWVFRTYVSNLPYSTWGFGILILSVSPILAILIPVISVVAAESILGRKWLWGVYFAQMSATLLVLVLESGFIQTFETIMATGLFGVMAGFFTFLVAGRLAGYNIKNYSYLEVILPKSTHEIASCFRNRHTFAHEYRSPIVVNENPIMINIKLIQDSAYAIRVFGREEGISMTRLELVAFKKRSERGILDRNIRSDAFCNDILALVFNDLNFRAETRVSVTSRPVNPNREMEQFALREERATLLIRIKNTARLLHQRRVTLVKLFLLILGAFLIYQGFADPEQAWLKSIGFVLAVISFTMQVWGPIRTLLGKGR